LKPNTLLTKLGVNRMFGPRDGWHGASVRLVSIIFISASSVNGGT